VPNYTYSAPLGASAFMYWTTSRATQTFNLRWRPVGNPNWNTVNNVGSNTNAYSYGLVSLKPLTAYEWQVQNVCSSTVSSDFTPIEVFSTLPCQTPSPIPVSTISSSSAYLNWSLNYTETGRTTELRYRVVGSTDWIVVGNLTKTEYLLGGLLNNTQYEWQVKSFCAGGQQSEFSDSSVFTTTCAIPQGLVSYTSATVARLSWYVNGGPEPSRTFELQYRVVGSESWNTISSLSTTTYSLMGLSTNVTYEWRVRQACSVGSQSEYAAPASFTPQCYPVLANFVYVSSVTSSSAQFFWYAESEAGTTYEIRYRPVGSPEWKTVTGLTATTSNGSYIVTGLVNNSTFEWQIRRTCSPSASSEFIVGPNFTTRCQIPDGLMFDPRVSSSILKWNSKGDGVTYDLRYRRVGASEWTLLNKLPDRGVVLSGLLSGAGYQYQVRTNCADDQHSDYSVVESFSTPTCFTPSLLEIDNVTGSSATLKWQMVAADSDTRIEFRYRPVGATDWTTFSSLTTVVGGGYTTYDLTDLTGSTQYEWQVRTICSPTQNSAFSSSFIFNTKITCESMYTLKSGNWNDTGVWSCGRVPTAIDVVYLKHAVTIPQNYQATAGRLVYDGPVSLRWLSGARLLLSR
jgi:hypothetical protein